MNIGDTFVWSPNRGPDHLWIVISRPDKNGQMVLVNITDSAHGRYSFTLKPGQHRYIYKDSDVNFGDAIKTTVKDLQKQVKIGSAKPHDPMDLKIVLSIVKEAHTHCAFPPILRKYLQKS